MKIDRKTRHSRRRAAPLPLNPWKLLLLLALSCLVIAPLYVLLQPAIGWLLAWITRDLMVLASSAPYISDFSWARKGFLINSPFYPIYLHVNLPVLPFMFAFPIAYSLALPWVHWLFYLRRVALGLLISFLGCAAFLAIFSEAHLAAMLMPFGITLHEPWRRILVHSVANGFWELGAIAYPLAVCVILSSIAITDRGRAKPQRLTSEPSTRRRLFRLSCALVLLAFVGCEYVAHKRLSIIQAAPRWKLYSTLEDKNPKLGMNVMLLGNSFLEKRQYGAARSMYVVAMKYPKYAERARVKLERADAHLEPRRKQR